MNGLPFRNTWMDTLSSHITDLGIEISPLVRGTKVKTDFKVAAHCYLTYSIGYKAVYVPMDSEGNPTGGAVDLLAHQPPNANWENGFRPVDVSFDDCGRLFLSSDGTNGRGSSVVRIEYTENGKPDTAQPSLLPSTLPTFQVTELTSPPTFLTSNAPTSLPTSDPTTSTPSQSPSMENSLNPTDAVSSPPTVNPSTLPSGNPTNLPTSNPTTPQPSIAASWTPSNPPTPLPLKVTNATLCGDFNHTHPCEFSSSTRPFGGTESLQIFAFATVAMLWMTGR